VLLGERPCGERLCRMKLRILVIDPNKSLRELLQLYLERLGHSVRSSHEPRHCSLFCRLDDEQFCCPQVSACADVVFMDMLLPQSNTLNFFQLLRRRGCKTIDVNKTIMSTGVSKQVEEMMAAFGCNHMRKPFRLDKVRSWVEECASRSHGVEPVPQDLVKS